MNGNNLLVIELLFKMKQVLVLEKHVLTENKNEMAKNTIKSCVFPLLSMLSSSSVIQQGATVELRSKHIIFFVSTAHIGAGQ